MKHSILKHKNLFLVVTLTTLLLLVSLPTAVASEVRSDDIVRIKSDEVINDDLILAGNKVIIDGVVKGDVIAFGQAVTVNGTIEGDLMAAAQVITVDGEVTDDLRAGGMALVINGTVGDEVLFGGFSLESGPESSIGGDLLMGGGQALIDGQLAGDINAGLGGLQIAGQVGGNVEVEVGEPGPGPSPATFMASNPNMPPMPAVPTGLTIEEGASIAGDLSYRSPAPAQVDETAIAGEVSFVQQEVQPGETFNFGNWLWDQIQRLLRLLLVGALVLWLAPVFMGEASQKVQQRLWASLGWGVLTPFIFLIVLIVLGLISFLVGFPTLVFGTLIFGYLLVLFYLGAIVVSQFGGRWLLQRFRPDLADNIILATLLGVVILWLVTLIPIVAIIGYVSVLFGAGALWLVGRERVMGRQEAVATT
jgi:cytoskeletal protein CcmA (bactofilin family)